MRRQILAALLLCATPAFGQQINNGYVDRGHPVDLANSGGANVVAAHSLFRAMSRDYAGPLFQVQRASPDTHYHFIYPNAPGGLYNAADLTNFCGATNANGCTYVKICDQIGATCNGQGFVTFNTTSPAVNWGGHNLANGTQVFFDLGPNFQAGDCYGSTNGCGVFPAGLTNYSADVSASINATASPGVITLPAGKVLPNCSAVTVSTTGTLPTGINAPATATISIASPAVVTMANSFVKGQSIVFTSTGSLPTGITAGTVYFVSGANLTTSSFELNDTFTHATTNPYTTGLINTSGSSSGTITATPHYYSLFTSSNSWNSFELTPAACAAGAAPINFSGGSGTQTLTSLNESKAYYVINSTPGLDGGAGTFDIATTHGGAAVTLTSTGTSTASTPIYGAVFDNSVTVGVTAAAVPPLTLISFPSGFDVPAFSTSKGVFRNRDATVNIPVAAQAISVYDMVSPAIYSGCCGTYGDMEAAVHDTGAGHLFGAGVSTGAFHGTCANAATTPCLVADIENNISGSTSAFSGKVSPAMSTSTTMTIGTILFGQPNPGMFISGTGLTEGTDQISAFGTGTGCWSAACGGTGTYTINNARTVANNTTITGWYQQGTVLGNNFLSAWADTDGTNLDLGYSSDQTPAALQYGPGPPTGGGSLCCHEGGLSIGEGGDGTGQGTIFLEGLITAGVVSPDLRTKINTANYNMMHGFGTPAPAQSSYYNFVNASSLPSGWSYSGGVCTSSTGIGGNGGCYTGARYTDAAGADSSTSAYKQFASGSAAFDSNGYYSFYAQTEYLTNNDTNYSSAPAIAQTVNPGAAGWYHLFCNGASGSTITMTNGTGVTANSGVAQPCDGSSYQDQHVTTSGTFTITTSGTVYWADLQKNPNAAAGFPPGPHMIGASSGSQARTADQMTIGGQENTWLESATSSVILDVTPITKAHAGINGSRFALGGAATGVSAMSQNGTNFFGGPNNAEAGFVNVTVSYGTTYRHGAAFSQGAYMSALGGTFMSSGTTESGNNWNANTKGSTHFLGVDTSQNSACSCTIKDAAFYNYTLGPGALIAKSTVGAALP